MEQSLPPSQGFDIGGRYVSIAWHAFLFLLHMSVVYLVAHFCVAWLAGRIHGFVMPLLQMPSNERSFEFLFNHLAILSVSCGVMAAVITAQYGHGVSRWVWIVPAAILAYKFATFPSTLFQDHFAVAFRHYFAGGFVIPEFSSYHEMFAGWSPENVRGIDQMQVTAPAYVGISYSIGSWLATRLGVRIPDVESWFQRTGHAPRDRSDS
jgi:hypothetical protein